ncbi:unnamed protein product [Paramecium octaurelia]|uniref:Transmembrane protein n=1 Tax=Paramecium octaurelia TaxID=43137 RepID=A0A8S1VK26_PAROT|nr:unnamed protein product [Paramecium octaurelia]
MLIFKMLIIIYFALLDFEEWRIQKMRQFRQYQIIFFIDQNLNLMVDFNGFLHTTCQSPSKMSRLEGQNHLLQGVLLNEFNELFDMLLFLYRIIFIISFFITIFSDVLFKSFLKESYSLFTILQSIHKLRRVSGVQTGNLNSIINQFRKSARYQELI